MKFIPCKTVLQIMVIAGNEQFQPLRDHCSLSRSNSIRNEGPMCNNHRNCYIIVSII